MNNLTPSSRIIFIIASGFIGAVIGMLIGGILKENLTGYSLFGFFVGLRIGSIIFRKHQEKTQRNYKELPEARKHEKIPETLKDSYYSDLVMKRIMEIYQPQQVQTIENKAADETNEDVDVLEEADDTYNENGDLEYFILKGEETPLNFLEIITFPTQIPLTLAIFWPIVFLGMGLFFPNKIGETDDLFNLISVILLPSFILIGLSGILVITQRKTVNLFGQLLEDSDCYFDGIVKIVISLAGFIYFIFIK